MDSLAEKLNTKLHDWQPDIADQVRQHVNEIIEMADQNTLDILRSRVVEQEVLDLLDEP
jgi:shikimate kinase